MVEISVPRDVCGHVATVGRLRIEEEDVMGDEGFYTKVNYRGSN